ncbi:MAG: tetraacyldisaccharide 4'-kinase [Candidatus Neomarinimicrobiota bacterium]|nr:MAG: tetraacyldisaccharide 4'-kinase [Candidatus Neomarinimicrobiota bacterium]
MNPNLLRFLTPLYGGSISLRNLLYDSGIKQARAVDLPVLSVGNLTVGGTGKTPVVIALAQELARRGWHPAILSRGYGRTSRGTIQLSTGSGTPSQSWQDVGDEPYLMALSCPDIPVVVDEDRVRGARYIQTHLEADLVILDDAFQHRRLHRDCDIVLLSAGDSRDRYRLLPGGRLREPLSSLRRAHVIFLTKTNLFPVPPEIRRFLASVQKPAFQLEVLTESPRPLETSRRFTPGKSALLVSGIGDPASFEQTVRSLSIEIREHLLFRDHRAYTDADVRRIETAFHRSGADYILTTEKDAVRLQRKVGASLPVAVLPIRVPLPAEAVDTIQGLLAH